MRISGAGPSLALAFALAATASPARAQSTNDLRTEAYALYKAGRYREAIPYLDAILAHKGRDIEAHIRRGNSHIRLNRPDLAIVDYESVLTFKPNFAPAYINHGVANLMLGRYDAAGVDFSIAIRFMNGAPLRFDPAMTGYDSSWNTPTEVVGLWNEPATFDPSNYDRWGIQRSLAHCGLAQVHHRLGRDTQAIAEYNRAIQLNSGDPNNFAGRGDAEATLGQLGPALADYDQALRLAPNHSRALAGRGDVYARMGRTDQALADFTQAIALDPTFARAVRLRAALLSRSGRNDEALADLDRLLASDPTDVGALKDRGGVLVRMRRYDRAIADLDQAIRLDPRRVGALLNRGTAHSGLGRYARAIEDFDAAIKLDPGNVGAFSNRGLARVGLGEYERALEDLSEAMRLDPRNPVATFNRAETLAKLRRFDDATRDYDQAIRLDPRLGAAYAGQGRVFETIGQPDRALEQYNKAVQMASSDAGLHLLRSNLRYDRGDADGAIADTTAALAIDPRNAYAYERRGWWRLIADRDGGDEDARAFLTLRPALDRAGAYAAVLGALAARRAGRGAEADEFLAAGLARIASQDWPAPILRCLHGTISEANLLDSASNAEQRTEARAFLGIDQLYTGRKTAAAEHLRWVRDHGVGSPVATDLARAALQRLEPAGP